MHVCELRVGQVLTVVIIIIIVIIIYFAHKRRSE